MASPKDLNTSTQSIDKPKPNGTEPDPSQHHKFQFQFQESGFPAVTKITHSRIYSVFDDPNSKIQRANFGEKGSTQSIDKPKPNGTEPDPSQHHKFQFQFQESGFPAVTKITHSRIYSVFDDPNSKIQRSANFGEKGSGSTKQTKVEIAATGTERPSEVSFSWAPKKKNSVFLGHYGPDSENLC